MCYSSNPPQVRCTLTGGFHYYDDECTILKTSENKCKFKAEDFTEGELQLLRMAFKLVEDVVEMQRYDNYNVYMSNELYHLKEKLGIYDLID